MKVVTEHADNEGEAMKIYRLFVILFVLTIIGCSSSGPDLEDRESNSSLSQIDISKTEISEASSETESVPEESDSQKEESASPEPTDEEFVRVRDYIPDIVVDLHYATENNFTGQRIYDFTEAWLRYGTVKKLMLVQEELKQSGLYLKIWDGFRPVSAQFRLWEVCPDPVYVADPNEGFSSHSRGNTVDITLVIEDGTEVVMPTGFDDFSALADRDYSDCGIEAAANALFLEECMTEHGFSPYFGEWWHFSDTQSYPVEQEFEPAAVS